MALPVLSVPEFLTKIPSTGKEISYRPFLVKEEKILLIALAGREEKEISNAIINIIESCIVSKGVDVSKLPTFDIEYLFLKIRGKSVGEEAEFNIGHTHGECKQKTKVLVNLDNVEVVGKKSDGKIMLNDNVGIKFRYPSIRDISGISLRDQDAVFGLIERCVEYVFDQDSVYQEFTHEELRSWIEGLNKNEFSKIFDFFNTMPKLQHEVKWKCASCGEEDSIMLDGLQDFFMLG